MLKKTSMLIAQALLLTATIGAFCGVLYMISIVMGV